MQFLLKVDFRALVLKSHYLTHKLSCLLTVRIFVFLCVCVCVFYFLFCFNSSNYKKMKWLFPLGRSHVIVTADVIPLRTWIVCLS